VPNNGYLFRVKAKLGKHLLKIRHMLSRCCVI
jgi:hypothetical protein